MGLSSGLGFSFFFLVGDGGWFLECLRMLGTERILVKMRKKRRQAKVYKEGGAFKN